MLMINPMRTVSVILLSAVLAALAAETNSPPASGPTLSQPAPAFSLKDLDGAEVSSTNFAGTTRLVWFWASWDKPSQRQLPALVELQREFGAEKMRVLGLVLDAKNPAAVKTFCATNHVNFPVLIPDYETIQGFGGLEAIPTTIVVEPHGIIVNRYVGYTEKETLKKIVQAILDSPR